MSEEAALFIDFENIRYSMLNIQRREPDPQELITITRRYGIVMVARAYADWTRQPEPFKGSLTAAMIDRVDCPAKQRHRIRSVYDGTTASTIYGGVGNSADPSYSNYRQGSSGNSGPLPAINPQQASYNWSTNPPPPPGYDASFLAPTPPEQRENTTDDQQRDFERQPYQNPYGPRPVTATVPQREGNTGPLEDTAPMQRTRQTGHLPAINGGSHQNTAMQSTVDLNMMMDIIETVFDRPNISTFVLMTGDKDFTRISARLKFRLNKTVIIVGVPGTVSRDLISSANHFVPLVPTGSSDSGSGNSGPLSLLQEGMTEMSPGMNPDNTEGMPSIQYPGTYAPYQTPTGALAAPVDVLDPQFLQFFDYIDRNWPWRTITGIANFLGDTMNPKNRFRGRFNRDSAREFLYNCIQEKVLLVQVDATGMQALCLNRTHPEVAETLRRW